MVDSSEEGRKTILVVDDNDLNLKLLKVVLGRAGYRVLTAESGEEGLEIARREIPHAVLMDLKLPGIDGLETTRLMKADPVLAPIPVVAVTAWAGEEDREMALSAGCSCFVSKPVEMKELVQIVRNVTGS